METMRLRERYRERYGHRDMDIEIEGDIGRDMKLRDGERERFERWTQ